MLKRNDSFRFRGLMPSFYRMVAVLLPERHCTDHSHGDVMAVDATGCPYRHLGDDSHGFTVERRLYTFEHCYMRYGTVGIDNERAGYPSLHASGICFGGIAALLIDKCHHCGTSARKFRLLIYIVKLIHNLICLASVGSGSDVDSACLCRSLRGEKK